MSVKKLLDDYLRKDTRITEKQIDSDHKQVCDLDTGDCYTIRMNIGALSKEDQLFFSFKDGNKLRLESNGELTSDNTVNFKLTDLEFAILKTKEIESVRYINGNDFSSFQYKMTGDESTYFINLFTNYYIREVYCDNAKNIFSLLQSIKVFHNIVHY